MSSFHVSIYPIFSLKLCTLCVVTTSSLNAFHLSTVLCEKLYFPLSFTHCLILIFTCPLVLPAFSVTSIRSSLSIFSMPFTIIYIVIKSPCSLLSYKAGSPISFSLS
ncbi:hypothetical protein E2C01_018375 [Portunus trituberculatus]|uniref:Uncharacterized protein n=1 Tax=Portunus trituberculatus TaxID=210409 RepID=A0A5B7DUW1_PORTR|nr:hypothetical protein [Portunus trituberculatus]